MFRAFPTLLRIGLAEAVAYRAELVIWVLTATAPLISMFIWDRVAEEGPLGGWGQGEMARYFLLTLIVRHITSAWVVWELNENIRTGGLSPMLLRPMHPLVFFVAQNLAAMPLRAVILAPLIVGVLVVAARAAVDAGALDARPGPRLGDLRLGHRLRRPGDLRQPRLLLPAEPRAVQRLLWAVEPGLGLPLPPGAGARVATADASVAAVSGHPRHPRRAPRRPSSPGRTRWASSPPRSCGWGSLWASPRSPGISA
jgi:hypothetical protein